MNTLMMVLTVGLSLCAAPAAQDTFAISGTAIPPQLLKLNYGAPPKGIQAFDLNICNMRAATHSITSSEIYQALAQAQTNLRPIGRQIMLAAILHNQNHSLRTWISLGLGSTTSVLSVLGTSKTGLSSSVLSGAALGALIGEQLLSSLSPVLTSGQVERFEAQVLEPALVMDGGSCFERTVFTSYVTAPNKASQPNSPNFEFHVR